MCSYFKDVFRLQLGFRAIQHSAIRHPPSRAHACRRLAAARAEAAMTCSTDIQFNAETIKALADKPQAACVLQASSPKINELSYQTVFQ
jgi:hypothetical protein